MESKETISTGADTPSNPLEIQEVGIEIVKISLDYQNLSDKRKLFVLGSLKDWVESELNELN